MYKKNFFSVDWVPPSEKASRHTGLFILARTNHLAGTQQGFTCYYGVNRFFDFFANDMSMLEFQPKIILTPNDTLMLSMLGKFRTLYTGGISLHDLTIGGPSKKLFFYP